MRYSEDGMRIDDNGGIPPWGDGSWNDAPPRIDTGDTLQQDAGSGVPQTSTTPQPANVDPGVIFNEGQAPQPTTLAPYAPYDPAHMPADGGAAGGGQSMTPLAWAAVAAAGLFLVLSARAHKRY